MASMELPLIDLDLFLSNPPDSQEVIHECKKACVSNFIHFKLYNIPSGCRCTHNLWRTRIARFSRFRRRQFQIPRSARRLL